MAASEGNADDLEEFECFVLRHSSLKRFKHACDAIDSGDAERSRRVHNVDEWDEFMSELNAGTAHAVGYKWFPYTAGGTLWGIARLLEVEIWFDHPGSKVGKYLVLHVHFDTSWYDRREPGAAERVTAISIRHTQSTSRYWKHNQETYDGYGVYSEEGGGHFKVAAFDPPWDRKDDTASTRINGTKASDVRAVLEAGFGSEFYFDKPEHRSIGVLNLTCMFSIKSECCECCRRL